MEKESLYQKRLKKLLKFYRDKNRKMETNEVVDIFFFENPYIHI